MLVRVRVCKVCIRCVCVCACVCVCVSMSAMRMSQSGGITRESVVERYARAQCVRVCP